MKKYILVLLACALSACSMDKQSLGMGRQTPDEFTVMTRQPLSMPPEYNVTPPEPGKEPLKQSRPEKKAEKVIFGGKDIDTSNVDSTDGDFLDDLGTNVYHPNIRQMLDKEIENDPANNKYLINNLMFWKDQDNSVVIDNMEEAKRIKSNKKHGLNIDDGVIPVIEPKK